MIERTFPRTIPDFPRRLRVVTFNAQYGERIAALISTFTSHADLSRADVVLLQEIESHPHEGASRAAQLAAALQMGHVYTHSRAAGTDGTHGLAILARWPLHDISRIDLPRNDLPFRRCARIALAAHIGTPAGPLRLTSVHLDTRLNLAARIAQLTPALADHDLQIVAGDLNTLPCHFLRGAVPLYRVDQAGRLDEHVRALGFATPATAVGATHRHFLRLRLDAIYTRGLTAAAARVARDVHLSDHFPVWTDVELPS
jgi:endonuclease/exonuclease/phosphatase family metal-dependent hydrolase